MEPTKKQELCQELKDLLAKFQTTTIKAEHDTFMRRIEEICAALDGAI